MLFDEQGGFTVGVTYDRKTEREMQCLEMGSRDE